MVNDAVECGESDFQIINDFLGEIDKVGHKATFMKFFSMVLRVNITIVYEHTVCATSAFSVCMLRVVFNVVLF